MNWYAFMVGMAVLPGICLFVGTIMGVGVVANVIWEWMEDRIGTDWALVMALVMLSVVIGVYCSVLVGYSHEH